MGDPPRALVGPPGLWVWIIAFGLVMATAVVGFFLSDWANQKADQAALNSLEAQVGILDQLSPPASREGRVVVIIGTSLTGAALQSAGAPLDKYPASMKLVVLVGNNLRPGWFEGLVPALHRARPDLILLEPRLLSAIGGPAELPGRVQNLLHALLPQARSKGTPPACHGVIRRQSPKAGGASGLYQWVFDPKRIRLDRLPLLEGLRADGIEVGVVDLPRADELEAAAPNLLRWRVAMKERLADKGFFFWHPPGDWPAVDFCDMAHFNHEGAVLFNNWLSAQLKQKFALTP